MVLPALSARNQLDGQARLVLATWLLRGSVCLSFTRTRQDCELHLQATGFQLRPAQPVGDQVSAVMESVPDAVLRAYVLPHLALADLCRLGCVSRQLRALMALADEAWERMYFDACPVFFQAILLEGKQRDAVCFRTLMVQRCVSTTPLLSTLTVSAGGHAVPVWSEQSRSL